jgi:hypothetical protein
MSTPIEFLSTSKIPTQNEKSQINEIRIIW